MDRHVFKTARVARKMGQGALAKAVGLTPSEVSRIECGYRDIHPEEAAAIAAALGLLEAPAPTPVAVAANAMAVTAPSSAGLSLATTAVAAPVAPLVGNNLDDPANFTELPDAGLLERGALSSAVHRERLSAALARSTKILHTSRVRASIWREWRQFEKKVHALLKAG